VPDAARDTAPCSRVELVVRFALYCDGAQDGINQARYFVHLFGAHSVLGDDWGSEAGSAVDTWAPRVVRQTIHVDDDSAVFECLLGDQAGQRVPKIADIEQDHVIVGPAGEHVIPEPHEAAREGLGVFDDLELSGLVLLGERLLEEDGLCGDVVEAGCPLDAGERRLLNEAGKRNFPVTRLYPGIAGATHQYQAAAGSSGLVCAGGCQVRVVDGRGVGPGDDEAGDVGNVGHQEGTDLVGDFAELFEVYEPGVGAGPADY
jgi:hypothetical protein